MKGLTIKYNLSKIKALVCVVVACVCIFFQFFIPKSLNYLLLVILFLLFAYRRRFTLTIRREHAAMVACSLLFGGYLLLGATWAIAPHTTFATSVLTLVTLLIGIGALNQREFFRLLPAAIVICSVVQAIGMFMPLFSPGLYLAILSHCPGDTYRMAISFLSRGRLCGFNPQTAVAGFYMTVGIAAIFSVLLFGKIGKKSRLLFWFLLVVEIVALIMTFKRSGMVCAVVASMIVLAVNKKISVLSVIKYGLLIVLLGVVTLQVLTTIPEVNESIEQSFDRFEHKEGTDMTSGRGDLAARAISIFERNPILGVGYGGFSADFIMGAHNVYLEVLCEAGIIGLLLYVPLLVVNLWKVLSSIRRKDGNMMLLNFSLFIQLYYIIYSAVGNCLTDNFIFILYVLMAALPYAVESRRTATISTSTLPNTK